jgi:PTS system nitrogen regulatory IIA component
MRIEDILAPELVLTTLAATTKAGVLDELAAATAARHPEIDRVRLVQALDERERLNSTALGQGIAIPHGKLPGLKRVLAAFARSQAGVDFQSLDGKPTYLFFLLVAPEEAAGAHVKALARVSRLLKDEGFRTRLREAPDAAQLYRIICDEDARY